jgi:TolA-binding protein
MTQYHKALGMFLVTMFGLWGCARGPADGSGQATNDRLKALEAKTAKLEEDLKTALAAKDQLRKKLGEAQDAQTLSQQEVDRLQVVVKERDELLKARTLQRDQVQAKYEGFLKDLEDLAGRAKTALQSPKPAANTGVATGDEKGPTLQTGGGS